MLQAAVDRFDRPVGDAGVEVGQDVGPPPPQAPPKLSKRGKLPEDAPGNDNFRVLRYVAKVTINPAAAFGLAHELGSIQPGKMADLVLWEPAFFGAKPRTIIKGGAINWNVMGDPNASLPTPQPVMYRPMFGAFGKALQETSVSFVSQAAIDGDVAGRLDLDRRVVSVRNIRGLTKSDMLLNDVTPDIQVDPETYVTTASAVAIGLLAGLVCHLALRLKDVFKYDDALDVIAVHFVGGILGSVLVGFFGDSTVNPAGADGLFAGGGAALLGHRRRCGDHRVAAR